VDLVTASAFFDIASEGWTRDLVAVLAKEGAPLLAMLDYDGTAELDPPHADDALLRAAFNRHQRGDKGLGPAMGPEATDVLAGLFGDLGWKVTRGASPWILGEGDAALAARLIEGWVGAAAEEGLDLAAWKAARLLPSAIRVGHEDVFAAPL
jgi:hypothetical protein